MPLPLTPPLEPMLARPQARIPDGMAYEPKWDGFRCLTFRDHDDVQLLSRNGRNLTGYFPEIVAAVIAQTPPVCVLDGELVIVAGDRLDFPGLTDRIHPAASRVRRLAVERPARLICWDLLALGDDDLTAQPFEERRRRLVDAVPGGAQVVITPLTLDRDRAQHWFDQFEGAGLDGVIAKALDQPYLPGQRAMVKVKHAREADVVVAGYRLHKDSSPQHPLVGSLQLGLYDHGQLHFVGVASSFTAAVRAELATRFAQRTLASGDTGHPWAGTDQAVRSPGGSSRWATTGQRPVALIDPFEVATVGYDHLEGTRFRHTAQFRRWRPDRDPSSCTFDQLEDVPRFDLAAVLSGDY